MKVARTWRSGHHPAVLGDKSPLGEQLQPGDRIITGSVVQVPIKVGDQVVAEMGALGKVQLSIGE
jgi:2-keto-4-pentenoate hydratase